MATLKAIKNNYKLLTMRERFGLYQKALLRDDDNELAAIYSATPMKAMNVIDFYFLREEIFRLDTINLLQRLGYSEMFNMLVRFAGDRNSAKKESDKDFNSSSLSAYLYVIETDAWSIVCNELGFEVNFFRTMAKDLSFSVEMMEKKDGFMRDCAFTEKEAKKHYETVQKEQFGKATYDLKTIDGLTAIYRELSEKI